MVRSRYLIPVAEEPRVRRAADVTRVVLGLLVFLWTLRRYRAVPDVDVAMAAFNEWIPGWLTGTLSILYTVCLAYALGLFVAVVLQWRSRLDAVRDMVLAAIGCASLASLLALVITGGWPRYLIELGRADLVSQFPIFRVALITAALTAVTPHLTRPMRRLGRAVIVLAAISGVGLGLGLPSSAFGSVGLGLAASGLILLVFGSPRGYPDTTSISDSLIRLGVPVSALRLDDDQSWGVRRLIGETEEQGRVEVKAYGRDATDSQLFARIWRYLWYRDTEPSLALTRMQAVEHEALVTMMAARTGASVARVLTAGVGGDDAAILAVDRSGGRLSEADPEMVDEASLVAIWRSVGLLHEGAISHGGLSCSAVSVGGFGHQIGDFGSGALAASDSALALDVVELLVSMSRLFGTDRAVRSAMEGLGSERLAEVLPYIQVPGVSRRERRAMGKPKALVAAVQDEVSRATAVEVEEPVQIRRVQGKNLLMMGLTLFAVYFLISQLSGIDFEMVWQVVRDADWLWIGVAFLVGQVVYFPEATAMLAAVGYPIPLRPVVILQSAMKFISLAVPSSAGRIAMTATFLRKYGVSFTSSFVQGSIDTISGLLVEVAILLLALVSGNLNIGLESGETEWGPIVLVIIAVAALVVLLVRRVKRLRDWVMPVLSEAFGAFREVLKDPKRTLGLLASNFFSRFVLAVSMWFILLSLDVSLGIWTVLTATVATGLLGGVVPIPGAVGVAEAALTAFLVLFGVDETTAFAAAVIYRVATFYIPSGAGFLSMRWLEKSGYI